jgi:uncharacterized OB-fold protein
LSGDGRLRNKFHDTEGGKDDGGVKKDRGRVFFPPDMMCCILGSLGTNERFIRDNNTTVRLSSFNETYTQLVK